VIGKYKCFVRAVRPFFDLQNWSLQMSDAIRRISQMMVQPDQGQPSLSATLRYPTQPSLDFNSHLAQQGWDAKPSTAQGLYGTGLTAFGSAQRTRNVPSQPWHGVWPQPLDQAQPFAMRDQPTEQLSQQAAHDPRNKWQRAADAVYSTMVLPNLSVGPSQNSALPQVSADYNPFVDRTQLGVNARWQFRY
jgi:hypothetical protein